MQESFPILQFDADSQAIIDPRESKELAKNMPERAVFCFFYDVIQKLAETGSLERIGHLISEIGPMPVYKMIYKDTQIAVIQPGVGAPLAAGCMEEMIANGAKKIVAVGGCGVLHPGTDVGHAFIIQSAVRDEGTSYHYLPAGEDVYASEEVINALQITLNHHQVPHRVVKSWTTDALFRETVKRRDLRIAQGCDVVEMEASAFFAVAKHRNVVFGQLVYGGDLVVPEGWDYRDWNDRKDDRLNMFHLAIEACSRL